LDSKKLIESSIEIEKTLQIQLEIVFSGVTKNLVFSELSDGSLL